MHEKRFHSAARACATALALAANAQAAPAPLKFQSTVEIPALSLSLPMPFGANDIPRQPSEIRRYRVSNGIDSWTEDRVAVDELWLENQFVCAWADPGGNVFTLARITHRFPPAFAEHEDALREEFTRHMQGEYAALGKDAAPDELAAWMARFLGAHPAAAPETVRVNTARLARVYEFPMADARTRAFAFRLEPSHPGQADAPEHFFALTASLASAPDDSALRAMRNDLLGGIGAPGAGARRAGNFQKNRTRQPAPRTADSAARERAKRSVEFLPDWWYKESPNYILVSDNKMAARQPTTAAG